MTTGREDGTTASGPDGRPVPGREELSAPSDAPGPHAPGGDRVPAPQVDGRDPGPWSVGPHGVWTVARLELRQRVRSTRWVIALVVWVLMVGAVTVMVTVAAEGSSDWTCEGAGCPAPTSYGPTVFSVVVFFVLLLGLLVAPTLTSGSINGDRNAGTLASLQMSKLSAAEIALGKLLAAWCVALAFLVASVPFLIWALIPGGTSVAALLVCIGVLAAELAVVCAVGLGFSALTVRTSGSAVLTYVSVAGLTVIGVILFALGALLATRTEQVRVWGIPEDVYSQWYERYDAQDMAAGTYTDPPASLCRWYTEDQPLTHTERIWWLLAPNPFVIVADAAPPAAPPASPRGSEVALDPLGEIRQAVRSLRTPPAREVDYCPVQGPQGTSPNSPVAAVGTSTAPVWPWGLGFSLLLGAGGYCVAVRRLTIPYGTLPRGTRVA